MRLSRQEQPGDPTRSLPSEIRPACALLVCGQRGRRQLDVSPARDAEFDAAVVTPGSGDPRIDDGVAVTVDGVQKPERVVVLGQEVAAQAEERIA